MLKNEGRFAIHILTKRILLLLENWVLYDKDSGGEIIPESIKRWIEVVISFRLSKKLSLIITLRSLGQKSFDSWLRWDYCRLDDGDGGHVYNLNWLGATVRLTNRCRGVDGELICRN